MTASTDVGSGEIVILNDTLHDALPIVDTGGAEVVRTDVIAENIVFTEKYDDDIIVDCVTDEDVVEGAHCKADACEKTNDNSIYDPLTFVFTLSDIPSWGSLGIDGRHSDCTFKVDESLNNKISIFAGKPSYMIKTDVFAYLRCRHLTEKQRRTSGFFQRAGHRFSQEYEDKEIGQTTDGKLCITKAFDLEHVKYIYHAKGPEAPHSIFYYYTAAFKEILETAQAGHHNTLVIDIWKEEDVVQYDVREGPDMIMELFRCIRYALQYDSEWEHIIVCAPSRRFAMFYLMAIPYAFPTVDYDQEVKLSDNAWKSVTDRLL